MKRFPTAILWIFLALFTSSDGVTAENTGEAASRFNEANALYRNDNYADALRIYQNLISRGYADADLYYNASNAAYRNGELGLAILYLEKARKLDPSDNDIAANLAFLNSIKVDAETGSGNAVFDFLSRHYDAFDINEAALWSGMLFALAMLSFTVFLFSGGWRRTSLLSLGTVALLFSIVATGAMIEKAHRNHTVVEAVLLADEAMAYSGPGDDNTHIFTIHEGTKVTLERSQDEWSLIRLKSGSGGWIRTDSMAGI